MKEYKVGDTIYAKGTVGRTDDTRNPCYVEFGYGVEGWIPRDTIIDELPTAEPVKPVLPKDVADELEDAKQANSNFYGFLRGCSSETYSEAGQFVFYRCGNRDTKIKLLSDAWYNGYTVEQVPRYMVYVPGTNKKFLYNKRGDSSTRAAKLETPIVPSPVTSYQTAYGQYKPLYWFTDKEIAKLNLQDCEKELVADDSGD